MSLEPGQSLLHYRIIDKLGEGGMGAVYRAEDSRLGREIAIKVMPPELARDEERRHRFEHEARVVAALNHPNIVTIHSVEEADGVSFLTMELIEGRPLSELIPQGGLDLPRLFELAIPAAEALSSAHAKGVTHRDLKPANMMLDGDGRLKVLDFGLAKLLTPEVPGADTATQLLTSTPRTEEGKILGTAAYMSPEQAEGKAIDARTDIFSFGVVLFEMATGHRPFQGDTAISTISSILKDVPPRVSDLKPMLPRHLGRIIDRCLEKNPAKRFQTARDIVNELENLRKEIDSGQIVSGESSILDSPPTSSLPPHSRSESLSIPSSRSVPWLALGSVLLVAIVGGSWWMLRDKDFPAATTKPAATAAALPARLARPMIAVLPFENLGPEDQAYFAAGMTDEIIGRLSGVGALGVISRTSVTQYDRSGKTMRQIGDDLGVNYVLEGTVRWASADGRGGRVRITPQLVRVEDDSQLWAQTYDQQIDDIFEVQSKIAGQVIDALEITLAGGEREALEERPTDNLEAYQAYLKAKEPMGGRTFAAWIGESVASLERATELDPNFLEAWVDLSGWHCGLYQEWDRTQSRLDLAKQAMQRALALDPDHPSALMARGIYHYQGFRDYDRALADFQAVVAAVPNNWEAQSFVGYIHRRQGRLDEALAELEGAAKLAPRDTNLLDDIASIYRAQRKFDRSIELRGRIDELEPTNGWNRVTLAFDVIQESGDVLRGLDQWRELPAHPGSQPFCIASAFLSGYSRDFVAAYDWAKKIPAESPQIQSARRSIMTTYEAWRDGVDSARASLEAVAAETESRLETQPGHAGMREGLGMVYAWLGDAEAAVREGRLAVDLTARDRWQGPKSEANLARIYARLGQADDALDLVERLLEIDYEDSLTLVDLRLDPSWDPIRDDARFRGLVGQ